MKKYFFLFLSLILNILLVGYILNIPNQSEYAIKHQNFRTTYPYLSSRIFVSDPNDFIINLVPLRKKLGDYENNLSQKISIYFEYLPSGASIGIHEKESFAPASLLKVPLAMGVFKQFDDKTLNPEKKLVITEDVKDPRFGTLWQQKTGTTLTVEETVQNLLIYSDDTAQEMLLKLISGIEIDNVFDELDIPKTRNFRNEPIVTAKNFSSILRCLYLSCYNSVESSNHILDILTQTKYHDKLLGQIPPSIKIAHKIGVIEKHGENTNIYSDCGIIYVPKRPFILCVMIQSDAENATRIISDLGKIAYDYIVNLN